MPTPPTMMIRVLAPFAPLFSKSVFEHVQVLMAGAILTPGKRTISSALRSEMAIQRTAPALLTLFSLIALFAHQRKVRMPQAVRRTAWYDKEHPTFSDALALVRMELWARQEATFCGSALKAETVKVPRKFIERLTDAVCCAA